MNQTLGRVKRAERPALRKEIGSVLEWTWPVAPATLSIYDKYTNTQHVIRADEDTWEFSYKAGPESIVFASGKVGSLQRRLALLTCGRASPGLLHRVGRLLVRKWDIVVATLNTPPESLRTFWDEYVTDAQTAWVNKKVLKLACAANVGHWSSATLPLVRSLDTRSNFNVAKRITNNESRNNILSTGLQASIVNILDDAASNPDLSPSHLDGAAALALIYQHGVRPVQAICLGVEDVRFYQDAVNEMACLVSFHAAKQRDGKEFEILRQVKPDWVPIIERLHKSAVQSGRSRIFEASGSTTLWNRAKSLCNLSDVNLSCTAPQLRHTAAQSLADAGHSRKSIQHFLGHASASTASVYVRASLQQTQLINSALGISKLYTKIHGIASKTLVTLEQMLAEDEDKQIGAVVGESLVSGIGLCRTGQSLCNYNPVTSCYGCKKFMPSSDTNAHREAVSGMRQQVRVYLDRGVHQENPAYRQLARALSGAQQALSDIEQMPSGEGR